MKNKELLAILQLIVTRISEEMPANTSDLTNDSDFQTETQVLQAIQKAIAESGHPTMEIVETVPSADDAQSDVFYLVKNTKTKHYDIYMLIGDTVEWLDDTTVDLSNYSTTEQINSMLESKVEKDGDKVLSDVNFSNADKNKLDAATKVEKSDTEGNIKIDGTETTVVAIPTEAEVTAMLNEVFGA